LAQTDLEAFFGVHGICRTANRFGALIWQIEHHLFHQPSLRQNVGEIEWGNFLPKTVRRQTFAWQKNEKVNNLKYRLLESRN